MRFSRGELLGALAALAGADVAMKTGQDGRIRIERVLVELLATKPERTTA
jgi:DNA polymerase-3 subunit delta